jgi:hypothetical protein
MPAIVAILPVLATMALEREGTRPAKERRVEDGAVDLDARVVTYLARE